MRKVLLLLFIVSSLTLYAQKLTIVDADVNLSGKVIAFCDSPTFDCERPYLPDGFRWHLTNKVLLGKNFITFHISGPDGKEYSNEFWPEGCAIFLLKQDGYNVYQVQDSSFRHLFIFEREDHDGYIVLLGSVPLE